MSELLRKLTELRDDYGSRSDKLYQAQAFAICLDSLIAEERSKEQTPGLTVFDLVKPLTDARPELRVLSTPRTIIEAAARLLEDAASPAPSPAQCDCGCEVDADGKQIHYPPYARGASGRKGAMGMSDTWSASQPPITAEAIRADERRKVLAELRAKGPERIAAVWDEAHAAWGRNLKIAHILDALLGEPKGGEHGKE